MDNQYQPSTQTQNLQRISNPQNTRDTQTIQQGVLETNQASSSLFNSPNTTSITVAGFGEVAPNTENTQTVSSNLNNPKPINQTLLSAGVVLVILTIFITIYMFDKAKAKKPKII